MLAILLVAASLSCGGEDDEGPLALPAPGSLQVSVGTQVFTLSWTPVQEATAYNVYYASAPGVTRAGYAGLPDGTRMAGVASPLSLPLAAGKDWYFRVTATAGEIESPESSEIQASR